MSNIITMYCWSRINKNQYDRLVYNIKAIGLNKNADVELIVKAKTVGEISEFNAKCKSIKRKLSQDFRVNILSHAKDKSIIKIYTVKPKKVEKRPTNTAVILGFLTSMKNMNIFNRDAMKIMYKGLMDKHRETNET